MTTGDDVPDPSAGPRAAIGWFLNTEHTAVVFVREAASSALVVAMVGLLLFAASGVWPPLVAIESGSMEPNMQKGDLVFVVEEHRFNPGFTHGDTGVVPHQTATEHDYWQFGRQGDVIVYEPYGSSGQTPVIHRAMFWVDEGENWYDQANPEYVDASSCDSLPNCPAPHAGFITKGDNAVTNNYYDQTKGISSPVKPDWIRGTAEYRVPWLGWVRLAFSGAVAPGQVTPVDLSTADASMSGLSAADASMSGLSAADLPPVDPGVLMSSSTQAGNATGVGPEPVAGSLASTASAQPTPRG